jgi:hypothetical protein
MIGNHQNSITGCSLVGTNNRWAAKSARYVYLTFLLSLANLHFAAQRISMISTNPRVVLHVINRKFDFVNIINVLEWIILWIEDQYKSLQNYNIFYVNLRTGTKAGTVRYMKLSLYLYHKSKLWYKRFRIHDCSSFNSYDFIAILSYNTDFRKPFSNLEEHRRLC